MNQTDTQEETTKKTQAEKAGASSAVLDAMFDGGVHYGYSKSRRHPSMKPVIYGAKNRVEIIDLEKTDEYLTRALEAVRGLALGGKTLLFVGTKNEAKKIIAEVALSLGAPYVAERWVGGTFTNFEEIKKRVARLKSLREQKEHGELEKYTKKERLLLQMEEDRLTKLFGGIENMTRVPDALFVVDTRQEEIAVQEAKRVRIPVIALMNSDCNLKDADFPIPGNDAGASSIRFIVDKVAEAYRNK